MYQPQLVHKPESRFKKWFRSRPQSPPRSTYGFNPSVFGFPLETSTRYANISGLKTAATDYPYVLGRLPVVVGECGLFLRAEATKTPNIFRKPSTQDVQKRLRSVFELPPYYGKGLEWNDFTVHDAAALLIHYLECLPDPVIPVETYTTLEGIIDSSLSPVMKYINVEKAIESMPSVNCSVLIFILDLLAVFASSSDVTLVSAESLATIFTKSLAGIRRIRPPDIGFSSAGTILLYLIKNPTHPSPRRQVDSLSSAPPTEKETGQVRAVRMPFEENPPDDLKASQDTHISSNDNHSEEDKEETITPNNYIRSQETQATRPLSRERSTQLDFEKKQRDYEALLAKAQQNVKDTMGHIDEKAFRRTTTPPPALQRELIAAAERIAIIESRAAPSQQWEIFRPDEYPSSSERCPTPVVLEDLIMSKHLATVESLSHPSAKPPPPFIPSTNIGPLSEQDFPTSRDLVTKETVSPPVKPLSPSRFSFITSHPSQQDLKMSEDLTVVASSQILSRQVPTQSVLETSPEPPQVDIPSNTSLLATAQQDSQSMKAFVDASSSSRTSGRIIPRKALSASSTNSVAESPKANPETTESAANQTRQNQMETIFDAHSNADTAFTELEISTVTSLLQIEHTAWELTPRLYIILRSIDCLAEMNAIVKSGFSDYELPVNERNVPKQLSAEYRTKFLSAQKLVLTPTTDIETRSGGQHYHFGADESIPFLFCERLGAGGFGEVDKVRSIASSKEYALKRYRRRALSTVKGLAGLRGIIAEIEILKTLSHEHIVKFVGSYTDKKYLGLLMIPVAESDLADYLLQTSPPQYATLRSFFGCLTAGLDYLHTKLIRHKDIKPGNILVYQGRVLLTDFGLARDFTGDGSTTAGSVNGLSARYAAPEVLLMEPRNTKSDIWSLGVVFLEMLIVLKRRNNEWLNDYMLNHGDQNMFVRTNRDGFIELVSELKKVGDASDNVVLTWVSEMLQEQHILRPTASSLLERIISPDDAYGPRGTFCGLCCRYEDSSSDSESESE